MARSINWQDEPPKGLGSTTIKIGERIVGEQRDVQRYSHFVSVGRGMCIGIGWNSELMKICPVNDRHIWTSIKFPTEEEVESVVKYLISKYGPEEIDDGYELD